MSFFFNVPNKFYSWTLLWGLFQWGQTSVSSTYFPFKGPLQWTVLHLGPHCITVGTFSVSIILVPCITFSYIWETWSAKPNGHWIVVKYYNPSIGVHFIVHLTSWHVRGLPRQTVLQSTQWISSSAHDMRCLCSLRKITLLAYGNHVAFSVCLVSLRSEPLLHRVCNLEKVDR